MKMLQSIRLFESITTKEQDYKNSKVMLCTFHAIWKLFKGIHSPNIAEKGNDADRKGT
jgi:hypothetical protein